MTKTDFTWCFTQNDNTGSYADGLKAGTSRTAPPREVGCDPALPPAPHQPNLGMSSSCHGMPTSHFLPAPPLSQPCDLCWPKPIWQVER